MNKHEEIFAVAQSLPEDEREAYLKEACESPEQRRRVRELLEGAAQAATFLEELEETVPDPRSGEEAGTVIGRYKLLQKIGEGGMGEVWMAEQREPVERRVALKIIKAGMDTRAVVPRFEAERQALAMMNHPGIAQVFDGGSTERGRPTS